MCMDQPFPLAQPVDRPVRQKHLLMGNTSFREKFMFCATSQLHMAESNDTL